MTRGLFQVLNGQDGTTRTRHTSLRKAFAAFPQVRLHAANGEVHEDEWTSSPTGPINTLADLRRDYGCTGTTRGA